VDKVVIIGMACRYPDADDPEQLWQTVLGQRRCFRPLPAQRVPLAEYGGPGADQTYLTLAAVLDGWQFDRQRFKVPGDTYRSVDLSHWLALEVSAAALADAGLPGGEGVDRDRIGVVLGNSLTGEFSRAAVLRTRWPYVRRAMRAALPASGLPATRWDSLLDEVERQYKSAFPEPGDETLAGALANTIAGRICNHFDFHGTGYTVDGACASSLLAVGTAAAAVAEGQLDVALAGGVDLSLDPFELIGFARLGALARDEMRVYDRRPTGFLPGEGCGVVVLCREAYAQRNGLRPYAYLHGWGTSSDGAGGLTRPEPAGQRLALNRAYQRARLAPTRVGLVEGHGTGTEMGDRVELEALLEVRGAGAAPAALGSVKAHIGHTKAAAGVAGLIKASLALHHDVLPPTTGCAEPHPLLATPGSTLSILDEARPWPAGERYAAVSAMGFGGINTHVVLGGVGPTRRHRLPARDRALAARHPDREVVACTAETSEQLAVTLRRVRDAAAELSRGELTDLAATLAVATRGGAPARFAAAPASPDELARAAGYALDCLAAGERTVLNPARRVFLRVGGPLRVGLLFSGQAAPCPPGAGALGLLLDHLPPGYEDPLPLPSLDADPVGTALAQPAIVRASLLGLRWLHLLGARAHEALGHSLGEIAALVWAGALDEADAYTLACARGAAMAAADPGPSGMVNVATDRATVTELLRGGDAVLAADNGEGHLVVSGPQADLERVVAAAARRGVRATWLPVAHAFHSPLMAPAACQVKAAAADLGWRPPAQPVASTVTGEWLAGEDPVEVLVRQLTAPVLFRDALALLRAELLVEVGPGRVVADLAGPRAVALDAGAQSAEGVAVATAALFAAGACPGVQPYFARRVTRHFDLDRPRRFLTNPCETLNPPTVPGTAPAGPAAPPSGVPADVTPPARPAAPTPAADPVAVAIARVAAAVELDAAAIPADARLLTDLHLSSLRVSQLAGEVATDLGRALPAAPLALATATVAEFAAAVAALPEAGTGTVPVAGVAHWVRAFHPEPVPSPAPDIAARPRRWDIASDLSGHPLAAAVRAAFPDALDAAPARLLALPPGLAVGPLDGAIAALRACHADGWPLVVLHHGGVGAAVGRSLAAEDPRLPVLVVEVPATEAGIASAAVEAHRDWDGYAEIGYGHGLLRTVPAMRPLAVPPRRDGAIPLDAGDACVVTGGAKGIGLECAVGLAAATRARLVLLGRAPASEAAVRGALARVAATGAGVEYHSVDVTDAGALAGTLAGVRERHGPVRGLLHAAGHNRPAAIPDLTPSGLRATLAPKAQGLEYLLAALDPTQLRLAVAFGSVIGRTGLAGEAEYAIANEWLTRRCAELATRYPEGRWLAVEWSAWADTGMGVRLGVLDGLIRQGLAPVPPDAGVDLLLRLLARPELPPAVLVTGRLPASSTLRWHSPGDAPCGRFATSPLHHTPGVELVAATELSLGTDPYLADHRIDGVHVVPAVLGLEAMAQACAALGAGTGPARFSGVTLARPVTVPERGQRELRVAALVREEGGVDVVVRSDETGFAADHFTARYSPASPPPPPGPVRLASQLEPFPAGHLYGPVFFHGPRFQRVLGYHALSAYRCAGVIDARPGTRWFGAFLEQHLELGDPGARDAFLHILQGCVPDRRVLPVGVDDIAMYRPPAGRLQLDARQRDGGEDEYLFDLTVAGPGGELVEEWRGVRLRAVGPLHPPRWPVELLGPYLARSLERWHPGTGVDLAVAQGPRTDKNCTEAVAAWLSGARASHDGAGRPRLSGPGGVSASHLDDWLLVATAPGPIAVDWERAGGAGPPLGAADTALATQLGRERGEPPAWAAARVWTGREAMRKLGLPPDAPLVLGAAGPDGWQVLAGSGHTLRTAVVESHAGPVAVCVGHP